MTTDNQPMTEQWIPYLLDRELFSEIDLYFARLMCRLSQDGAPEIFFAAALASRATAEGHVCLDMADMAGRPVDPGGREAGNFTCPGTEAWRKVLEDCPVVGAPGAYRPLVLDANNRLYLYRYWEYEDRLARLLTSRAAARPKDVDKEELSGGLRGLFGSARSGEPDLQKLAAFCAMAKRLCVISGGPGTGKSTVVAKILSLFLGGRRTGDLTVALAAPTGKAAARLQEAVFRGLTLLPAGAGPDPERIPKATTIHRLLGSIPGSPYFRHHADNPLPFHMVVVDEASMVDLALMAKLVGALPEKARLVLLGDRDQLASVEAGAVLGDIWGPGKHPGYSDAFAAYYVDVTGERIPGGGGRRPGIPDCLVQLEKSYRFGAESGIGALSAAVNRGDGNGALGLIQGNEYRDVLWNPLPPPEALKRTLKDGVLRHFQPVFAAADAVTALHMLSGFRILCALRKGPYGLAGLNAVVEKVLRQANLIRPDGRHYRGRPILITRNDYQKGLFNGDTGILWEDPRSGGELRAFFAAPDREVRKFLPATLPEHETAYAMTVHRSQGSEFQRVLLVLPEIGGPLLTRELLYTAVTRARETVEIWGKEGVFTEAVRRRTKRTSGLRETLWGPQSGECR